MNKLFVLRGELDKGTQTIIQIVGAFSILLLWYLLSISGIVSTGLLPSPIAVLQSLPELHFKDALVKNLGYSMYLNTAGYIEAVLICVPVGFIVGLLPLFKGMFSKPIDAIRFIPLTAVTGLFIAWFGIENEMKIQCYTVC